MLSSVSQPLCLTASICDSTQLTVWLSSSASPNLLSVIALALEFQSDQFALSNISTCLIGSNIFLIVRYWLHKVSSVWQVRGSALFLAGKVVQHSLFRRLRKADHSLIWTQTSCAATHDCSRIMHLQNYSSIDQYTHTICDTVCAKSCCPPAPLTLFYFSN